MLTRWRSRKATADVAASLYDAIVDRARQKRFYTSAGVPDTLDGRFEMISLHAFLVMRRLKDDAELNDALGQALFDRMFDDMDRSLREMGAGDLGVGRRVKSMVSAFYGRIKAYEDGLAGGDAALSEALSRNLYGTVEGDPDSLSAMIGYIRAQVTALEAQPSESIRAGHVAFADPILDGS